MDAFTELYDRFCGRSYRVAYSVCRDHGRAEDAVQEAFLSIWRNPGSYSPRRGTVAAWLLCSVRHRAIDLVRRAGRHTMHHTIDDQLQPQATGVDPAEGALQREQAARVQAHLALLPEAQQAVIALAYYGELTHAEIAVGLGVPTGTVKSRMRLGLHKLRQSLEPIS